MIVFRCREHATIAAMQVGPPLAGNLACRHTWRAQRALGQGRSGPALAHAMLASHLVPAHRMAAAALEVVARRVAPILPDVDAAAIVAAMDLVEGWLTPAEAGLLARCVAGAPAVDGMELVEIGSYCGRSTVSLALAIRACGRPLRLTAIDPHQGYAFAGGRDTYQLLVDTLKASGVDDLVDVVRARSVDVALVRPVGLVFIDGLHDGESVRTDYAHMGPHVTRDGLVAFHDYRTAFPGVMGVVNDLLLGSEHELVGFVDSLVVLRRL